MEKPQIENITILVDYKIRAINSEGLVKIVFSKVKLNNYAMELVKENLTIFDFHIEQNI